jgi:carbonic anhydrase/acetyltransferase-like protein (isoleucine patch superfamily)
VDSLQSIHESVWIAPGAQIYGRVSIEAHASLWPHAVIRAEAQQVRIGRMTNLQDFSMVHVGYDAPTVIGDFCSITHHATIHGAQIGDHCLIGIGATVMDGAVIGKGSIVGLAHPGIVQFTDKAGRDLSDREASYVAAQYLREQLEQEDERPLYDVSAADVVRIIGLLGIN